MKVSKKKIDKNNEKSSDKTIEDESGNDVLNFFESITNEDENIMKSLLKKKRHGVKDDAIIKKIRVKASKVTNKDKSESFINETIQFIPNKQYMKQLEKFDPVTKKELLDDFAQNSSLKENFYQKQAEDINKVKENKDVKTNIKYLIDTTDFKVKDKENIFKLVVNLIPDDPFFDALRLQCIFKNFRFDYFVELANIYKTKSVSDFYVFIENNKINFEEFLQNLRNFILNLKYLKFDYFNAFVNNTVFLNEFKNRLAKENEGDIYNLNLTLEKSFGKKNVSNAEVKARFDEIIEDKTKKGEKNVNYDTLVGEQINHVINLGAGILEASEKSDVDKKEEEQKRKDFIKTITNVKINDNKSEQILEEINKGIERESSNKTFPSFFELGNLKIAKDGEYKSSFDILWEDTFNNTNFGEEFIIDGIASSSGFIINTIIGAWGFVKSAAAVAFPAAVVGSVATIAINAFSGGAKIIEQEKIREAAAKFDKAVKFCATILVKMFKLMFKLTIFALTLIPNLASFVMSMMNKTISTIFKYTIGYFFEPYVVEYIANVLTYVVAAIIVGSFLYFVIWPLVNYIVVMIGNVLALMATSQLGLMVNSAYQYVVDQELKYFGSNFSSYAKSAYNKVTGLIVKNASGYDIGYDQNCMIDSYAKDNPKICKPILENDVKNRAKIVDIYNKAVKNDKKIFENKNDWLFNYDGSRLVNPNHFYNPNGDLFPAANDPNKDKNNEERKVFIERNHGYYYNLAIENRNRSSNYDLNVVDKYKNFESYNDNFLPSEYRIKSWFYSFFLSSTLYRPEMDIKEIKKAITEEIPRDILIRMVYYMDKDIAFHENFESLDKEKNVRDFIKFYAMAIFDSSIVGDNKFRTESEKNNKAEQVLHEDKNTKKALWIKYKRLKLLYDQKNKTDEDTKEMDLISESLEIKNLTNIILDIVKIRKDNINNFNFISCAFDKNPDEFKSIFQIQIQLFFKFFDNTGVKENENDKTFYKGMSYVLKNFFNALGNYMVLCHDEFVVENGGVNTSLIKYDEKVKIIDDFSTNLNFIKNYTYIDNYKTCNLIEKIPIIRLSLDDIKKNINLLFTFNEKENANIIWETPLTLMYMIYTKMGSGITFSLPKYLKVILGPYFKFTFFSTGSYENSYEKLDILFKNLNKYSWGFLKEI